MVKVLFAGVGILTLAICAGDPTPGSSEALRRHVEYLASDRLQGRGNGTPGMDAAAEYIAARFKEAGLQPAGTDGYFQTTELTLLPPNLQGFSLHFRDTKRDIAVAPDEILLLSPNGQDLKDVPAVKIDPEDAAAQALKPPDIDGKVALLKIITQKEGMDRWQNMMRVLAKLDTMHPALVVNYGPNAAKSELPGIFTLPGDSPKKDASHFPVRTAALRNALETMPSGLTPFRVTLHLAPPISRSVKFRNVAGMIPGSGGADGRYIVVTANYDGSYLRRDPDPILHSANANASAIASLIEAARELAASKRRPQRSIVFVALFGEQGAGAGIMSDLGAKTYLQHPAVPIEKTDACLKLVQLGRSDAKDGPKLRKLAITSQAGSRIPELFAASGKSVGVEVYEDRARDAVKTGRGFRPMLLDKGVHSHALYVAYEFPDAFTAGDTAKKLDYKNMAEVQRAISAGLLAVADSEGGAGKSPFDGAWIIETPLGPRPLEGKFQVNGDQLTGTMKLGEGAVVPISAGKVEGTKISFTFPGQNGRTLLAKGSLQGDEIEFVLLLPQNEFGSPYTAKRK